MHADLLIKFIHSFIHSVILVVCGTCFSADIPRDLREALGN